jgi:hypothetical protein
MENLLALLAAALSLDAKAVANSLGVAEDAQTEVVVKAVARLLNAGDQAARQVRLFAHSLGVAETADEPSVAAAIASAIAAKAQAALAQEKTATGDAGVKLLAVCNALGATPDQPLAELLALIGSAREIPAQSAAERLVENAISVERKITPANREAFIRLAAQDFEGAKKILNSMPPVLGGATSAASAAAGDAAVLDESDEWAIQQHGLRKEDYLAAKKRLAG